MVSDWVSAGIASVALLGVGAGTYIQLSSDVTTTQVEVALVKEQVEKLEAVVDESKEKIIRVEGEVKNLNENLEELTDAVSSLDSTVRVMNDNLVKLLTIDELRGED